MTRDPRLAWTLVLAVSRRRRCDVGQSTAGTRHTEENIGKPQDADFGGSGTGITPFQVFFIFSSFKFKTSSQFSQSNPVFHLHASPSGNNLSMTHHGRFQSPSVHGWQGKIYRKARKVFWMFLAGVKNGCIICRFSADFPRFAWWLEITARGSYGPHGPAWMLWNAGWRVPRSETNMANVSEVSQFRWIRWSPVSLVLK